ncbi:MAG: hypothetical protein FJ224_06135 [Lentisphaerae bacterium]|nr:hypothetical protein [Lentisphaerota bacterium]
MKRFAIALIAVMSATLAFGIEPVPSVNVVGYAKIPQPPGLDLKSCIFYVMDGSNTLSGILGTNGVAGTSETTADNVYLYIPNEGYKTYFLLSHANPSLNRKWIDADSFELATNEVLPGVGFWIRNRNSQTNHYIHLGEAELDATVTATVLPGLQMLAYPYSANANINGALSLTNGIAGAGETSADNIYIYTSGTGYKTYFLLSHANPSLNRKWIDADSFEVADVDVLAGQGFWYRSRASSSFQWVLKRPYLND